MNPAEIQALRARLGLTVDELAQRCGMTSEHLTKLECGRIKARGAVLVQFQMLQNGSFTRPRSGDLPLGPISPPRG